MCKRITTDVFRLATPGDGDPVGDAEVHSELSRQFAVLGGFCRFLSAA